MSKKNLDEMQVQNKNKIGSDTFLLLMYLLLLDVGLYGFGFRWISYPANVMIVLSICSTIYLFRLIKQNSYVGPSSQYDNPVLKGVLIVVGSAAVGLVTIFLLKNVNINHSTQIDNQSAPILFIVVTVSIVIIVGISIIKKIQNKNDMEE